MRPPVGPKHGVGIQYDEFDCTILHTCIYHTQTSQWLSQDSNMADW